MNTIPSADRLFIASITPYFLEKEFFWFQEHEKEVSASSKTQSFFQDNILLLERGQTYNISECLRKLDEMGYERVFSISDPGEFSQRGGVIDIFPINTANAARLDFLGNTLESIGILDLKIEDEKRAKEIIKKKLKSQKLFSDLKNIKEGDYLVHLDHGIGKFLGIEQMGEVKYYALAYAAQDKLYVPLGLERKLSRYIGFSDPAISRLGSALWQKTKRAIKENVEKLAKELLSLYAEKEIAKRPPYYGDQELEGRLQVGFQYEETPDQLQALEDIKNDLLKEKPMDRIVCGDVGFGKTEIALRTAFLAAINGRQTAIICPTTILASQHFANFKKRLENLPVAVGLISRLQTKKEQNTTVAKLKEGKLDILIGTHRLLSSDIEFKNLQLLIIDDEQRFGVKQKEKLRQKNPSLDILSLSATPIPRTMYLAFSSFKNISLMQTPPKGRLATHLTVTPYSVKTIKKAIEFELQRRGQVYFLHNRIESIDAVKEKLKKVSPKARISSIHGRMDERELVKAMEDFQQARTNVLVATTIIENGIDLPKVNTIIIEDASRLGLSQAYQIKGRVGRSHQESFAYLFHPKKLPALAKERLRALSEAKELGVGYRIAIKDMELRGAGNILGREQSGSINKIGLNLYCQMLTDAVEKMRG